MIDSMIGLERNSETAACMFYPSNRERICNDTERRWSLAENILLAVSTKLSAVQLGRSDRIESIQIPDFFFAHLIHFNMSAQLRSGRALKRALIGR